MHKMTHSLFIRACILFYTIGYLAVGASRAAPLEYRDTHHSSRHEWYASERERVVNGPTFSVIHFSPYGITLQK